MVGERVCGEPLSKLSDITVSLEVMGRKSTLAYQKNDPVITKPHPPVCRQLVVHPLFQKIKRCHETVVKDFQA